MKLVELYARVRYAVRIEALSRREAARRYGIVRLGLPRLLDTLKPLPEVFPMPKSRLPCSPEFRRQMVDLVRAGQSPEHLAREFDPTAQSIGA